MIDSDEVKEHFNQILQNCKKTIAKEKIEEFDAKVNSDQADVKKTKEKPKAPEQVAQSEFVQKNGSSKKRMRADPPTAPPEAEA